jgi:hypothetical protein
VCIFWLRVRAHAPKSTHRVEGGFESFGNSERYENVGSVT